MNDDEIDTAAAPRSERPFEEHFKDLMRAACDFAVNGNHEEARVCLDIATFIDKRWL